MCKKDFDLKASFWDPLPVPMFCVQKKSSELVWSDLSTGSYFENVILEAFSIFSFFVSRRGPTVLDPVLSDLQ